MVTDVAEKQVLKEVAEANPKSNGTLCVSMPGADRLSSGARRLLAVERDAAIHQTQGDEEDGLTQRSSWRASMVVTAIAGSRRCCSGRAECGTRPGTADLAAGRAESAGEAEAARPAVAERRFVRTVFVRNMRTRLELRFLSAPSLTMDVFSLPTLIDEYTGDVWHCGLPAG